MNWFHKKKNYEKNDFLNEELTTWKLLFCHGLVWDPNLTTREKLRFFLRSNLFHLIIIMLVIIDLISVGVELAITSEQKKEDQNNMNSTKAVFKYISLSILSIFMIEIIVKVFVLRKEMLRSKADLFDALVVLVSFGFDLAIILHPNSAEIPIEFLAVLRLWRIIRVIDSVIVVTKERAAEHHHHYKEEIRKLKEENELLKKKLDEIQDKFKES